MDTSAKMDRIVEMIHNSQWGQAKEALEKLRRKKISGADLIRFASLCRRANLPSLGLSVLRPVVRPSSRKTLAATPQHLTEYAACLIRVGACREAEALFTQFDLELVPESYFYKALLHVKEWEYEQAISLLSQHIDRMRKDPYVVAISQLNLAMCLLFEERNFEARNVLVEVLNSPQMAHHRIISGNCHRLFGNLEFQSGDSKQALVSFQKALEIFGNPEDIDAFLARKWVAITNHALKVRGSSASVRAISQEAVQRMHWESLRDIDYQIALLEQDEDKLIHLHFGTPFVSFKRRIERRFPDLVIPQVLRWSPGNRAMVDGEEFDLRTSSFRPGQTSHRLLSVLMSDFYRPFHTLDLFQGVFPGEVYASGHSEQRVYQALARLRRELKTQESSIKVSSGRENQFRLGVEAPVEFVIHRDDRTVSYALDHRTQVLRRTFGANVFMVTDVMKCLGLARRTANDVLKEAVQSGVLLKLGSGAHTHYRISETIVRPASETIRNAG
ncbi:MAG: hypothetical protein HYR96_11555 [Deltaproteobacteria bacterium]|nr:hypothetical protein [Deltaproteobacteria bacterium]MBI3294938.1 hypothetical protein [Deltaproteobacteria bacterium]